MKTAHGAASEFSVNSKGMLIKMLRVNSGEAGGSRAARCADRRSQAALACARGRAQLSLDLERGRRMIRVF